MKNIYLNNKFKKELSLCIKRGFDLSRFDAIYNALAADEKLPEKHREHVLSGNWAGYHECHIAPDWLLIWLIDGDNIYLVATGTHSDLFN